MGEGRKIAIIGTTGHANEAPLRANGWERWLAHYSSLSGSGLAQDDRVYELHDTLTRHAQSVSAIRNRDSVCEVWCFYPDPDWTRPRKRASAVRVMPTEQLVATFGRYFTNSVAWMLAHAIQEHLDGNAVATIGVYGIDMATSKEFSHERPSVEYFLGWARGAGIEIILPASCDLLHCANLYGLDHDTWYEHKLFEERLRLLEQIRELDPAVSPYTHHALSTTVAELDYLIRLQFHTPQPEADDEGGAHAR